MTNQIKVSSKRLLLLLIEAKAVPTCMENRMNVRCLLLCFSWFDQPELVCLFPQLGHIWSKIFGHAGYQSITVSPRVGGLAGKTRQGICPQIEKNHCGPKARALPPLSQLGAHVQQ